MMEEWRDIPSYPRYEISSNGHIRNKENGRILKPVFDGTGRARIRLTTKGITYSIYIHDILIDAFLGGRNYKQIVSFKNNVPSDCRLSNIEVSEAVDGDYSPNFIEGEVWRDVVGYEKYIAVSNLGRVWTKGRFVNSPTGMRYLPGSERRMVEGRGGYPCVYVKFEDFEKGLYVHRLVAEAFLPNPNNYPEINHKDETRTNNHVDNLEWCTHRYNLTYGTIRQRIKETRLRRHAKQNQSHEEHKCVF